MQPITHIFASTIVAIALWPFFGPLSLAAYVTGVFVDVDHLWEYFKHQRKLSYFQLKEFYRTTNFNNILQVFHTIEFFALLIILSFVHSLFLILAISYAVHWSMDFIHQIRFKYLHHRAFSVVWWLFAKKRI